MSKPHNLTMISGSLGLMPALELREVAIRGVHARMEEFDYGNPTMYCWETPAVVGKMIALDAWNYSEIVREIYGARAQDARGYSWGRAGASRRNPPTCSVTQASSYVT